MSGPIDQAAAVPGFRWIGWAAQPGGRCAWLPEGLVEPLGVAAAPVEDGTTCRVALTGGDQIKIRWGRASPLLWDPFRLERPATVGGLEARTFAVNPHGGHWGACQVSVRTGGFSDLVVLAWSDVKPADTRAGSRCAVAHRASELVVRRMVPAAGGTPWSKTPQTPSAAALAAQHSCAPLAPAVDDYLPDDVVIRPVHDSTAHGRECSITTHRSRVVGLFSQHPVDPPVEDGVLSSPLPMGQMSARTEQLKEGCAAAVEVTC